MEVVGLFKNYDSHHVESLETPLVEMSVLSVNYWLTKFVQEVAKPSKERYPPRTLYGITVLREFGCFLYFYCMHLVSSHETLVYYKNPKDIIS